jgi:hypothetical protein
MIFLSIIPVHREDTVNEEKDGFPGFRLLIPLLFIVYHNPIPFGSALLF